MSLVDESARFTYSGHKPVPSPCGRYIAYLNGSKLVIRKSDSLTLDRLIKIKTKNSNGFLRISQITWEPLYNGQSNKVAVLVDNENTVKIYDMNDEKVDISIIEDDVFGIENFQWLPKGEESIETAYDGSKQIVVFTKNELYAKIYSLDYSQVLISIEKPKFNKVLIKPNSNIFSIITSKTNGYVVRNYLNNGSSVAHFNNIDIDSVLNLTDSIDWSPNGQWLLCNDSVIGETKVSVYSLFNEVLSQSEALFRYEDVSDPLGAIDVKWGESNEHVFISDHHEQIHCLDVYTGLNIQYTLQHKPQTETSKIWKQDNINWKYVRKQTSYKFPQIGNLPLHLSGVTKFLVNGNYTFVTVRSMPGVVFIWDVNEEDSNEPEEVLVTNTRIKDMIVANENKDLLLVVNEDSITLWHTEWSSPIVIPWEDDEGSSLKGACFINATRGSGRIMLWTSTLFEVVQIKLSSTSEFEGMDSEQIDVIRNGSPALIDDLTHVVELANGVQQSEWGHNNTNTIQLDDTFMTKKQHKSIRK